jgi:hypothetical protein
VTARMLVLALLGSLVAACGGEGGDRPREEEAPAAPAGAGAALSADVQLAVNVARAVDAAPASADSILAAHGLTLERLDSLMYAIAADSAKTAAYDAALR